MRFVIVTGVSGAGKSTVLKMLEDAHYFCVDNLPIPLVEKFASLMLEVHEEGVQNAALGIDARSGRSLEELAIELACQRMTDEEIEQLGERQNDFKNAINKGNAMNIAETDEAFHDVIYLGTGNDKLVQILNNLREQMYRYRLEYIKDEDKRQILIVEHEHILAAIKAHNIAEAKNAAREHIDNQEITVSKNIKEQEDIMPVRGRGRR